MTKQEGKFTVNITLSGDMEYLTQFITAWEEEYRDKLIELTGIDYIQLNLPAGVEYIVLSRF